jgi:hypothetical protein
MLRKPHLQERQDDLLHRDWLYSDLTYR